MKSLIIIWLMAISYPNLFCQDENAKLKVIVFLGIDCPISQDYIPELNKINLEFKETIVMIGYFPGEVSEKQVANFNTNYSPSFKTKIDKKLKWVKKYQATITPEVFLMYNSNLVYSGAIDDWYYELGRHMKEPTKHFLINAIENTIQNKPVNPVKTIAKGCFIERSSR